MIGKRRILKSAVAGCVAAALGVFAGAAGAQTVYKLGSTGGLTQPEVLAAKRFAELVSERTGGKIRIDVLAGGQAGGEREIAEGMQIGTMHFGVLSGILQNFDPAMMILEWDLLFNDDDHVRKVWYGPVGDKINERLSKKLGVQNLAVLMRTPRLLTTHKPVRELKDLEGMKIRVPEMKARLALWEALGARPTPMAWPEVTTALQLKTIDGQENPVGVIESTKLYESVKNLAITNHLYGFQLLLVSGQVWKQLSPENRQIIAAAAKEAGVWNDKFVKESEQKMLDTVSKHMTVTKVSVEPWRAKTKDVYKKFSDVEGFTELYLAIVDAGKSK